MTSPAAAPGASVLDPSAPLLDVQDLLVTFSMGSAIIARMRHEENVLRAVDGVDLTIQRGEALALVGESGSGKSTLARALTGLQRPDRGDIRLDGKLLPGRRSRADQRKIQMVFQDPYSSLNPRLTVGGMLHELLRVHHIVPTAEVEAYTRELLGLVGLTEEAVHAYPRQFSGGQRQRVAIARALMNQPKVLFADEPTGNLDFETGRQIMAVLERLHQQSGQTIVMVTHDRTLARKADRVLVLEGGMLKAAEK